MDKSQSTRVKRTQKDYTLGFKLAVVEQVEKGDMTYKQAQKHYGIQGRSTRAIALQKVKEGVKYSTRSIRGSYYAQRSKRVLCQTQ